VSWDVQGRIRIKDELLDKAQIKDEVILVGAFDRFELWSPEQLKKAGTLEQGKLEEAAKYAGI
jgi:DNA-binding transcriptional regulator/RsmH inhibitor MraZ